MTLMRSLGRGPAALLALAVVPLLTAACDQRSAPAAPPPASDAASQAPAPDEPGKGVIAQAAIWGATRDKVDVDVGSELDDNWYVVLDGSGSMGDAACSGGRRGGRIVDAEDAAVAFERRLPPDANLGLYVFDNRAWGERVALGHGRSNRADFEAAVRSVRAGAGTPLGPSLESAYAALSHQAARQGGYGTYHIVVATDGQATEPQAHDPEGQMNAAVDKIVTSPIVLETIGFCIDNGHALNRPGRTVYRNAMNPDDLNRGLSEILAETDSFSDDAKRGAP